MDKLIRNLIRDAVSGAAEEQDRLDRALDRIGRYALLYRGLDLVPVRRAVAHRRDTCPRVANEKLCVPRHRTQCAASSDSQERRAERRTRRVGRNQCAEGLADYYEGRASL